VFLGTFTPRLDDKGRVILPAKWREQLAEGLVMTKGQDRCLFVFALSEFTAMTERLREADRDFARIFFASAHDEIPDRQGRVTVPAALRDYAGLDRECTVIGANSRLEIWDSGAWESFLQASEDSYATRSDSVIPGI
jgi:MraZ protein